MPLQTSALMSPKLQVTSFHTTPVFSLEKSQFCKLKVCRVPLQPDADTVRCDVQVAQMLLKSAQPFPSQVYPLQEMEVVE